MKGDAEMSAKKKTAKTTIKFTTRANPFPESAGTGELFGTVIPNGTVNQDELIEIVAKSTGYGKSLVEMLFNHLGLTVLEEMRKRPCMVDLGFCKLRPVIKGTFEFQNEPFDPKRHKVEIEAIPSAQIRKAVAQGLKPVNVTPVEMPKPCIDSVCYEPDFAHNIISVASPFEVHGTGLTVRHGDESAELELPSGGKLSVTLTAQKNSDGARRVKAQLCETPPSPLPRSAHLVLRTHGLAGASAPLITVKSASIKLKG